MSKQSATHLGLYPPMVGILYQYISAPPSLSTLLNGCPLYRSPICYAKKFLFLLSFVVFQLVSILYQGFWTTPFYCLQTSGFACSIYFFFHISLILLFRLSASIFLLRDSLIVCRYWFVVILSFFLILCFFLETFGFHLSVLCLLVSTDQF